MTVKKVPMKEPVKTYVNPPKIYPSPKEPIVNPPKIYPSPKEPIGILANNPYARKQTRPTKASRAAMMKSGGSVGSASKRADGCAVKGKTRGKMV